MYIYAYDIHTYMMFMTYKCGFIHNSYCTNISVYQFYAHYPNRSSYIFIRIFIYYTQYSYSYSHGSTLQHTHVHICYWIDDGASCNTLQHTLPHTAAHYNTQIYMYTKNNQRGQLQKLQHVAAHCNTLQHAATHRKTHIHMYTRANRRGEL